MNLRKLLARCPNIAIALVPILVLAALIAALANSLAPAETAPIASEPSVPSSTELMDPTDPDAPELADIGYEKSQDGVRDVATFFFDLLDLKPSTASLPISTRSSQVRARPKNAGKSSTNKKI
ncbi:hypothetical protein ACTXL8_00435 [Glutamicibacter arilaitensis]|uniref:hypothetical protein n=1 Tax=Glutamicibacter arilaitensis TaxID=256701 RepID=UPI003FD6B4B2